MIKNDNSRKLEQYLFYHIFKKVNKIDPVCFHNMPYIWTAGRYANGKTSSVTVP